MPKVTVYIPSYNYGRYVRQAIESVLAQTFNDWGLVVINDASTDDTDEILKDYEMIEGITIINHVSNQGLAKSANKALSIAKGQYIMRLDADDFLDENALLVMVNVLDSHPEVGLVYPDYYLVDEAGEVVSMERRQKVGEEVQLLDKAAHGACTLIRKSCLEALDGYSEALDPYDLYDLWVRFVERFEVKNVNTPLFYYRRHEGSMTHEKERILHARRQVKAAHVQRKFGDDIPKVLGIIPARQHSSVFQELALQPIAGKPLIDYTLEQALATSKLDRVIVTSDDDKILGHVTRSFPQATPLRRPYALARPNSPIEPTVLFILEELQRSEGYRPDLIMLLNINAPLRGKDHIEKAIDTLLIFDVDSVVSIREDINFHYRPGTHGLEPLHQARSLRLEKNTLYEENGALYLSRTDQITPTNFLGKRLGHIVMSQEHSFRIYSQFDFWLVEKVLQKVAHLAKEDTA
ncbi:MAG: glycosyltransferase [bacterium]|nr:glycosyltransferase [bacterium]